MKIFGTPPTNGLISERKAAYVVIVNDDAVAMVRPKERCFLPGGGIHAGEEPEAALRREVREELGRELRDVRPLADAIQYFYSADDDLHYRMHAYFFRAELGETLESSPENALTWLALESAREACFHDCHAWAVRLAVLVKLI